MKNQPRMRRRAAKAIYPNEIWIRFGPHRQIYGWAFSKVKGLRCYRKVGSRRAKK